MNENERRFVLKCFAAYYKKADLEVPRIEQREFGIGISDKIDARHLSFANTELLRAYLISNTPMFISHSAAFYAFPRATPIEKKGWLGADLIFDLDVHLENELELAPLEQLKEKVHTLVEDFLIDDFGISPAHIVINFSGNRGYHIHVRDPNFADLQSAERREITDYIRGVGLNYEDFFTITELGKKAQRISGPTPKEHGWRGRFARAVVKLLNTNPTAISRKFKNEEEKELFLSGIEVGNWSKTSVDDIIPRLSVVLGELHRSAVLTDAAVTYDLSRLIRLQNSIHGGSGLIAKTVRHLENFEPTSDAVLQCPELEVKFARDAPELEFGNLTHGPFKVGEKKELPGPFALFLLLKGFVNLTSPPN